MALLQGSSPLVSNGREDMLDPKGGGAPICAHGAPPGLFAPRQQRPRRYARSEGWGGANLCPWRSSRALRPSSATAAKICSIRRVGGRQFVPMALLQGSSPLVSNGREDMLDPK